jgi:carboxylesterase
LKGRYRTVSVAGISMGATLALGLAGERSGDIAALAMLSTTLFYDGWNVSPFRFLLPVAYHTPLGVFYRKHRETTPFGLKNPRLRLWVEQGMKAQGVSSVGAAAIPTRGLYQAERLIRHVKGVLPRIQTPTLLIHATEDDVSSVRSPDYVEQHLGTRQVQQVRLSNSYHMITVDNERETVAQRSISFFRETVFQKIMETSRALPARLRDGQSLPLEPYTKTTA